jgi:hypothetical protein
MNIGGASAGRLGRNNVTCTVVTRNNNSPGTGVITSNRLNYGTLLGWAALDLLSSRAVPPGYLCIDKFSGSSLCHQRLPILQHNQRRTFARRHRRNHESAAIGRHVE